MEGGREGGRGNEMQVRAKSIVIRESQWLLWVIINTFNHLRLINTTRVTINITLQATTVVYRVCKLVGEGGGNSDL